MDEQLLKELFSDEHQALVLQGLTILTFVMPFIEKAVEATSNKVDDKILAVVQKVLAFVPRVRLGAKK